MDSFFSNSTLPFIGIQFFVGTTMICVKKLYTIMCHIEEDKNRKFYMQYYKICQLESELVMVKNKVADLTELCAQLQDQNASSSASTETCSIESISLQMPEKPGFDDCIEVVLTNADAKEKEQVEEKEQEQDSPSAKEEPETEEVMVTRSEEEEPKKDAPKYKYGLGFLIG
jgi:hypothetical protein